MFQVSKTSKRWFFGNSEPSTVVYIRNQFFWKISRWPLELIFVFTSGFSVFFAQNRSTLLSVGDNYPGKLNHLLTSWDVIGGIGYRYYQHPDPRCQEHGPSARIAHLGVEWPLWNLHTIHFFFFFSFAYSPARVGRPAKQLVRSRVAKP